ncbi:hypothetical protein D3C86_1417530 [compost metagenome]
MKSKLKHIRDYLKSIPYKIKTSVIFSWRFFLFCLKEFYVKRKYIILLLLIPLSEIKAIFYDYDEKVSWYIFSDNKRFACNIIENYTNTIVYGVLLFYPLFVKMDIICKQIYLFLLVTCFYDFVFTALFDNNYFYCKIPLIVISFIYANSKVYFQRN